MIYVISLDDTQIVKIGYGGNPRKRVVELQTGNPVPLILRWVDEGDVELENHLHAVFKDYRIRGEWFDLTPLGDAVAAVQGAVAQVAGQGLLKAARFRGPAVVHPAVEAEPEDTQTPPPLAPSFQRALPWEERFPPSARTTVSHDTEQPPRTGCIRAWKGACLRPAGMVCNC